LGFSSGLLVIEFFLEDTVVFFKLWVLIFADHQEAVIVSELEFNLSTKQGRDFVSFDNLLCWFNLIFDSEQIVVNSEGTAVVVGNNL